MREHTVIVSLIMKKKKLSTVKKQAWSAFSEYIRVRDCLKTTGDPDRGLCVTCNREYERKQLQAGHFIQGRTNAILFDEKGVHGQCYACNVGRHGATEDYWVFMEKEYGRKIIDEIMANRHKQLKFSVSDLEALTVYYKDRTKELMHT